MKTYGVEELARFPRPWRGAIWASQQEALLSPEKVALVAGWIAGFAKAPYFYRAQIVDSVGSAIWSDGGLIEFNFDVLFDEPFRNQLIYAFFTGIAFCFQKDGRWLALRCWDRIGQDRALGLLDIEEHVARTMLRLPGAVIGGTSRSPEIKTGMA